MKLFFCLSVGIIIASAGCAGMQPMAEKDLIIQTVVEVPGIKKEVIFDKSKMWIANNFRSAKAVIEYENRENGSIVGNGIISYPCSGLECVGKGDWKVRFTMNEDIKDGKFRLNFLNLILIIPPTPGYSISSLTSGEIPISQQSDFDKIKPILLMYGERIQKFISDSKFSENW